jgi:hypothetical protein
MEAVRRRVMTTSLLCMCVLCCWKEQYGMPAVIHVIVLSKEAVGHYFVLHVYCAALYQQQTKYKAQEHWYNQ